MALIQYNIMYKYIINKSINILFFFQNFFSNCPDLLCNQLPTPVLFHKYMIFVGFCKFFHSDTHYVKICNRLIFYVSEVST